MRLCNYKLPCVGSKFFQKLTLIKRTSHTPKPGARQNQQNVLCAQRNVRSAWATAQCNQKFCRAPEEGLGP